MGKTIAYLRVSTNKQDLNGQKLEVLEWAHNKGIHIDEFMEIAISTRKNDKDRRIDDLIDMLHSGDTLIVAELSRLGRSTGAVITLVQKLLDMGVRVILIKQGLDITKHDMSSRMMVTVIAMVAELERDMISLRTKERLQTLKAQGVRLGKPTGSVQKSKFDKDQDKIKELLELGLSVRKIAHFLGYEHHMPLYNYIKRRSLNGKS